jgi:hypothetical protein
MAEWTLRTSAPLAYCGDITGMIRDGKLISDWKREDQNPALPALVRERLRAVLAPV